MRKRGFVVLVCIALADGAATAQQIDVTVDGCAELARAVYEEIAAAAVAGPQRAGPWVISRPFRSVSICASTTKTVSRAFRRAMASAGVDVRWTDEPLDPADYCPGGFLAQCHPRGISTTTGSSNPFALPVNEAWSAVAQIVMRTMANPHSSNEVRFDPERLRLQLGLALRAIERPRRQ